MPVVLFEDVIHNSRGRPHCQWVYCCIVFHVVSSPVDSRFQRIPTLSRHYCCVVFVFLWWAVHWIQDFRGYPHCYDATIVLCLCGEQFCGPFCAFLKRHHLASILALTSSPYGVPPTEWVDSLYPSVFPTPTEQKMSSREPEMHWPCKRWMNMCEGVYRHCSCWCLSSESFNEFFRNDWGLIYYQSWSCCSLYLISRSCLARCNTTNWGMRRDQPYPNNLRFY